MLGEIDYNLKPIEPQYFLCKPNREIVSKLSEAFNDTIHSPLNQVGELEFSIPYEIDIRHKKVKNKHIDLLKERYLIKVVSGHQVEWYIVHEITDALEDDQEIRVIKCYSAYHELTEKLIKSYSVEAYYCRQVLTDLLKETTWEIDYIDADFDLTYRAFEFLSSTVLEAVYSVGEKYNAIVEFNSDDKTVSFKKPELFGLNKGLTFSWDKYLKSMDRTLRTDQMVTRLTARGKDDLTIHKVNPTGQGYIENFGYFMYPFERDSNKNVIKSSYHMSDSLCHALLDYQDLVESKTGVFQGYLNQLEVYERDLNQLEVDYNHLKNNEVVITDIMLAQQFDKKMFFEKYIHSGSSSRSFSLESTYAYIIMIKVDNTSGASVYLDGQNKTIVSDRWIALGKVRGVSSTQVVINGGNTGVFIQVANISLTEWTTGNNESEIVEKYSLDNKENQIRLKEIEIHNKKIQIQNVNSQIQSLQRELLTENNFTSTQLQELNFFVIEREFNDSVYIDEKDLYEATQEKFKELQQPQIDIDIDIVNFLEIIGEQRNWHKLVLGDFVNIKYEIGNIHVTARIVEINYDFEAREISLTLSNIKNINDESKKLEKFLSDSKNTNVVVDSSKSKWGKAVISSNNMTELFQNFWDTVTNQINMANNEFVQIDNRGITIYDLHDPNKFVRMTHGAIGMTDNGGLLYKMAITPTHIVAENVWGKLIVGERLTLGDIDGLLEITGPKFMIFDRCEREIQRIGLLSTNPDVFGTYVNRYATDNCNDTTIVNRVSMTNKDGFTIERFRYGVAEKTFGTSLDGDLYIKAGVDEEVFTIDKFGLALGASVWSRAPFRVDYQGNCWLYSLWATDAYLVNAYIENAEIQNSLFDNGHIEASTITLRDGTPTGIMKLDPSVGFWAGSEDFDDAIASIAMDGTAKFKKLIVTDGNNLMLMDSEQRKMFMNNWDIVGAGAIDAELLAANIVTAIDGFIANLTASRLTTLTSAAINDWTDYIRIEGNTQKFIRGKVQGAGTHKTLPDGRPLYWISSTQSGQMTTDVTSWPVMEYQMDELEKMIIGFDGQGATANPYIRMGVGDGLGGTGGRAFISKYDGGVKITYHSSGSNKARVVDLGDNGITISIEGDGHTTVKAHNIRLEATGPVNVLGSEYIFA